MAIHLAVVNGFQVAGLVKGYPDFEKVFFNPLAVHAYAVVPESDGLVAGVKLNRYFWYIGLVKYFFQVAGIHGILDQFP